MIHLLKKLWPAERGEALSEYAMLLLLMSLAVVAGMRGLASDLNHAYLKASARIVAAGSWESINTDPIGNVDSNQSARTPKSNGPHIGTTGEKVYTRSPDWARPSHDHGGFK